MGRTDLCPIQESCELGRGTVGRDSETQEDPSLLQERIQLRWEELWSGSLLPLHLLHLLLLRRPSFLPWTVSSSSSAAAASVPLSPPGLLLLLLLLLESSVPEPHQFTERIPEPEEVSEAREWFPRITEVPGERILLREDGLDRGRVGSAEVFQPLDRPRILWILEQERETIPESFPGKTTLECERDWDPIHGLFRRQELWIPGSSGVATEELTPDCPELFREPGLLLPTSLQLLLELHIPGLGYTASIPQSQRLQDTRSEIRCGIEEVVQRCLRFPGSG